MILRAYAMIGALLCIFVPSVSSAANLAIVPKLGTLGAGLDLGIGWSESFTTRLAINGMSLSGDIDQTDVTYDTDLDLRTGGLLFDWHPGGGVFRLSAGGYYNGNELHMVGKPTGGTFEINGTPYPAAAVGSLDGKTTFDHFAPYVGIGFSNAGKKGWKFSMDLGALYQNSPEVALQAQCGVGLPAPACAQLQSDTAAEQARLEDELKNWKWYPVFSVGIGYSF
jgi:hypothetical protein